MISFGGSAKEQSMFMFPMRALTSEAHIENELFGSSDALDATVTTSVNPEHKANAVRKHQQDTAELEEEEEEEAGGGGKEKLSLPPRVILVQPEAPSTECFPVVTTERSTAAGTQLCFDTTTWDYVYWVPSPQDNLETADFTAPPVPQMVLDRSASGTSGDAVAAASPPSTPATDLSAEKADLPSKSFLFSDSALNVIYIAGATVVAAATLSRILSAPTLEGVRNDNLVYDDNDPDNNDYGNEDDSYNFADDMESLGLPQQIVVAPPMPTLELHTPAVPVEDMGSVACLKISTTPTGGTRVTPVRRSRRVRATSPAVANTSAMKVMQTKGSLVVEAHLAQAIAISLQCEESTEEAGEEEMEAQADEDPPVTTTPLRRSRRIAASAGRSRR